MVLLAASCRTPPAEAQAEVPVDVDFEGVGSLFDFRLQRVIEDPLIDFARESTNEAPLVDAAQDLQDHYLSLGFPDARVDYRLEREPRLRVVFVVQEGPRVTVREVQIEGNETLPDDELIALWARTRSGLVGTGDPYFVLTELSAWRSSMAALYDIRGFLEAEVVGPIVEREPDGTTATVRFDVREGPRYVVSDLAIVPELPLDRSKLEVETIVGQPYDRDRLEALRQRARVQLEGNGYPAPRIGLRLDRDPGEHVVHAALVGEPGVRARVVGVDVEGLVRTKRSVLDRAIHFEPGEWYDGRKVEATTRDAYLTGLFRRVEVERRPVDEAGTEMELVVVVEEIEAREVDFLVGYGSYERLRGGITYTDRNFLGFGHRLSVGGRASLKSQALSTSYTIPNLFGSRTALTTAGYLREREEPAFTDVSRGIDVALSRDLFESLRGRVGYALQSRDARVLDGIVRGTAPDDFEIGSVFTELIYDRRDSPLYPSTGHRESIKLERARQFLGGDIELDRITWSAALFHPFAEDVVLGLSANGGIAWPLEPDDLPVQERFFNGGESSVRSFDESELGPRSPAGVPLGGQYFNTFSAEVRFPLLGALHGAVFGDAGNVGLDADSFGLANLRYGIGAGLRLVLPIGPIRFDASFNPDQRPDEEEWVLHLAVGLPF